MGYEATGGGSISIKREKIPAVVKALETQCGMPLGSYPVKKGQEVSHMVDVIGELSHQVNTLLYDYLIGIHPQDDSLLTIELTHSGKWNDDVEWLQAIAPYVEPSEVCIELHGEDDSTWGFAFVHGEMKELYPEIIWPKVLEEEQVAI